MDLSQLINSFVADVCAGSNETPKSYRCKLNQLHKFLGDREISQTVIDAFKVDLLSRQVKQRGAQLIPGQLSPFTIRSVLATVRHFLRWGSEHGHWPAIQLRNIKEPMPQPKAIDAITFAQLLTAVVETGEDWEQARNLALLYTLRDTGGRAGAVASMDTSNTDLDQGYAIVPDKGDQLSWMALNAPTVEAIRIWMSWRASLKPKDYLIWTGARGSGLTRQGIARVLSRLAHTAGATGRCNPHSFRHAFCRDALLAGADLGQVSQMANHKSIYVTDRYYGRYAKRELKKIHREHSPGSKLPMPE
jgi:site-specific recombinase XerD